MENQPIDQTALALKRAIFKQEGGDYNNTNGDNGTSAGAGQWNNGKIALKKGEIPANFKNDAQELGLDPNDFSETNQDHVAYAKIKKKLDAGQSQSSIAAEWNSGLTHGWENHRGTTVINGKTISYDTPAYVDKVKKFYEQEINGQNNTQSDTQPNNTDLTKDTIINSQSSENNQPEDYKASSMGITDYTPGSTLAKGLGYTINNAMGGQDAVIKANEQSQGIQGQLIQRIKEDKQKGKDTSKLKRELQSLTGQIQQTGNNVTDIGTGGITNRQIIKSALNLATLPALAYGASALKAGTLLPGTPNLLKSGATLAERMGTSGTLAQTIPKIMTSPAMTSGLQSIGMDLNKFMNLSNADKVSTLTNLSSNASPVDKQVLEQVTEKFLPHAIKEAGGKVAFARLYPNLAKAGGLIGKLIKGAISTGVGYEGIKGATDVYNTITK